MYTLLFLKFLIDINKQYELKNEDSDIVVLTGGVGRIKTGIELISVMKNSKLLISGVGSGVRLSDIIDDSEKFVHKIDLGYSASINILNSLEAKKWVQKHEIKGRNCLKRFLIDRSIFVKFVFGWFLMIFRLFLRFLVRNRCRI